MFTRIKTDAEIQAMRESGRILADILDMLQTKVDVGMTGFDIDQMAKAELKALGAEAPFLGYGDPPFPGVICISMNDEVEHGTPRDIALKEGDILSLDFGVLYKGMISDSGRTFAIGDIPSKTQKLLDTTEAALYAGIDSVRDGVKVGDISAAVEAVLKKGKYGIIRDLVGHGVGHELHEDPNIPNYGTAGRGPVLRAGMTICIEPMASLGDWRLAMDPDGWTIRMADGSLSAHFEHTLLITDKGCEIMTESRL
jgi:methionyl aminopeptidase